MAAWTEQDLITIRNAITNSQKSVTYADGRKVEYQSLDHLLAAEKVIDAALKMQTQAQSGMTRRRMPYYKSGLN